MFGTHRISWIKLLFALFLVAGLPIFIWAVVTQRIELRKRAATAEPTEICWNRVISFNNNYNWPNSCKGSPRTDLACAQILVPLSAEEVTGYKSWISAGKPYIPGCGPAPSPKPISECGVCNQATSCTSGLICQYVPTPTPNCPNGPSGPCSMPAGYSYPACVKPDGSSHCPSTLSTPPPKPSPTCYPRPACLDSYPRCAVSPLPPGSTYCTTPTPTCTPIPPCYYYAGTSEQPRCVLLSSINYCPPTTPTPSERCMSNADCPTGYICSATPPGGCPKTIVNGIEQTTACASVPHCWAVNRPTPTPTPPPNCYYKQVQCFRAPCPPILICPSPTSYQSPTPTPTLACGRGTPIVKLAPNDQSGNPGQTLTYTAAITNTDTEGCSYSLFALSTQVDTNFTAQNVPTLNIPALGTGTINVTVTSPAIDPYPDTRSLPVTFRAVHTVTNMSASANAAYTLVKPAPQQLKFLVELAGVNGPEAKGATITVKLKLQNGTVLPFDKPLVLDPVGNGVYSATATLTNPLPSGTAMRVLVKGEKHSQVVFCRTSGQTGPCNDTEYMTPSSYSFDFTGRPLPAGDLNQDGKVNADDLKFITNLFKKPSTQLTAQDLKSADVDYSGTIDAYDLNLVLQTLETRYDEQ